VRQRPRKPVDPHDDQRVAVLDTFEHARKHWTRAIAAGSVFFEDFGAASRLKGLRLGQGGLILRGNSRVAYQGHEIGPFAI
jgi:hypothetical protein